MSHVTCAEGDHCNEEGRNERKLNKKAVSLTQPSSARNLSGQRPGGRHFVTRFVVEDTGDTELVDHRLAMVRQLLRWVKDVK